MIVPKDRQFSILIELLMDTQAQALALEEMVASAGEEQEFTLE
jgi:hypothetical protein